MSDIPDNCTPEEWAEAERGAAEIMKELREHPIASALPYSRAYALTERIVAVMRKHGSTLNADDLMAERGRRLDEIAKLKEHES